jgi:hypothetical protein
MAQRRNGPVTGSKEGSKDGSMRRTMSLPQGTFVGNLARSIHSARLVAFVRWSVRVVEPAVVGDLPILQRAAARTLTDGTAATGVA